MRLAAEAWFRLDGYNKALQYITAYAKSNGQNLSREDNYLLGYTAYRTADYAGAVEPLKSVCTGTDNLAQNASYHLADCYIRLGDKRNAIRAFAMAADERYNNEISEDALFNYGKLLFETGGGTFNESINVLARYVNHYPDSVRTPEAKELLIAAYYNSKDYDMAYDAIRSFPNPDGSMKTALQKIAYFKGVEAFNAADYPLAKQSFEESLSIGVSPKYNALCAFWLGEVAYITDGTIYTLNSRVQLHHVGIRGDIYGFKYRLLCSYVRNFGNDNTSKQLLSTNTATLLEITKHVEKAWGLDFGLSLAGDFGTQFGNQFGAMITIRKQGIITQW